jgi:hypothetical protein
MAAQGSACETANRPPAASSLGESLTDGFRSDKMLLARGEESIRGGVGIAVGVGAVVQTVRRG